MWFRCICPVAPDQRPCAGVIAFSSSQPVVFSFPHPKKVAAHAAQTYDYDGLPCTPSPGSFCAQSYRSLAPGRTSNGALQLLLRPQARGRFRASHRGYRSGAFYAGSRRKYPVRPFVGRRRAGRRAGARRALQALSPVRTAAALRRVRTAAGRRGTCVLRIRYARRNSGHAEAVRHKGEPFAQIRRVHARGDGQLAGSSPGRGFPPPRPGRRACDPDEGGTRGAHRFRGPHSGADFLCVRGHRRPGSDQVRRDANLPSGPCRGRPHHVDHACHSRGGMAFLDAQAPAPVSLPWLGGAGNGAYAAHYESGRQGQTFQAPCPGKRVARNSRAMSRCRVRTRGRRQFSGATRLESRRRPGVVIA